MVVELYTDPEVIEGTIVAIGSHDLALDLMAQFLAERHPGRRLQSAHAGSLGGLLALRRGECHLAGTFWIRRAANTTCPTSAATCRASRCG